MAEQAQNRLADRITAFVGSMAFVYFHVLWFGFWIGFGVEDRAEGGPPERGAARPLEADARAEEGGAFALQRRPPGGRGFGRAAGRCRTDLVSHHPHLMGSAAAGSNIAS